MIDSAAKRLSAGNTLFSGYAKGVLPKGSVDAGSRHEVSWVYRGLADVSVRRYVVFRKTVGSRAWR